MVSWRLLELLEYVILYVYGVSWRRLEYVILYVYGVWSSTPIVHVPPLYGYVGAFS
jgi:hypothetical protein